MASPCSSFVRSSPSLVLMLLMHNRTVAKIQSEKEAAVREKSLYKTTSLNRRTSSKLLYFVVKRYREKRSDLHKVNNNS